MDGPILYRQLLELAAPERAVPMHMPGHKRALCPAPGLPVSYDLTEVEGADDLHSAHGILADAMKRTAELWGSPRTFYLVNGSTCGILAGIRALAPFGSTVIAARNCHQSVFHAIELGGYHVRWLYPAQEQTFGICASIAPEEVRRALREVPEASAVILTSPTYEGVLSEIGTIAGICHESGVPLLVDEAHGAHLDLFPEGGFTGGALRAGADLVVQSPHKTLPSLTQTALLHVQGSIADPEEVRRQLRVFETSSPSYPLMVSLDGCTSLLSSRGKALFAAWGEALDAFSREMRGLEHLRVLGCGKDKVDDHPEIFGFDKSKILIRSGAGFPDGMHLMKALRERYGIETEMQSGGNVLAMTGCGDGEDPSGIRRLAEALLELDRKEAGSGPEPELPRNARGPVFAGGEMTGPRTIAECAAAPRESVPVEEAEGRLCAEYVYCYPPGVPALVPGERIDAQCLSYLEEAESCGTAVVHSVCGERGRVACLKRFS